MKLLCFITSLKFKAMPDDKNEYIPQDLLHVFIKEDHEVKYWTTRFACSAAELVNAVKKVGNSAKNVEEFLKQNKK